MKRMVLDTRVLVEAAVAVALAAVLGLVRIFRLPQGGSVSLEMLPLYYIALRRGGWVGVLAGAVYGLVDLAIDPYVIHPVQLILDYPLPFALLGVAGFFPRRPLVGVTLGTVGRYLSHLLSGVIFFASYAPAGQNVWAYSALYNASYLVPELVIGLILMAILLNRQAVFPRSQMQEGNRRP